MAIRRFAGVSLLLLAVGVSPVAAHHGWSSYDSTTELTLTGIISGQSLQAQSGGAAWGG